MDKDLDTRDKVVPSKNNTFGLVQNARVEVNRVSKSIAGDTL